MVLASGNDGYTITTELSGNGFRYDGYTIFTATGSTPFTPNMVGKLFTMWVPNSGSSEDSVYRIIGYISSTQIVININNGGTPSATNISVVLTWLDR